MDSLAAPDVQQMVDRRSAVEADIDLVVAVDSVVHTDRIGPRVPKELAQLDHVLIFLLHYTVDKATIF